MEKLDKVIAGLTGCIVGNCSNCEYGGDGCHRNELMEDALEVIRGRYHRGDSSQGDLISRSALLEEYEWLKSVVNPCSVAEVEEHMERIRNAPAVEAEPWNPVTNHQRIARMSVPEMAEWLWSMKALCDCCEKQYICGVPDDEVTKGYCLKYVEKWLEQEVVNDV